MPQSKPDLVVFVSYSHDDDTLRAAITPALQAMPHVKVIYDENRNLPALEHDIHKRIRELILRSHVLLALVTPNSMGSLYSHIEWVIAREAHIPILSLCQQDCTEKLPHFMQHGLVGKYSHERGGINAVIDRAVELVGHAVANWHDPEKNFVALRQIYSTLTRVGDTLRDREMFLRQSWRLQVIQKVLDATNEEVSCLTQDKYTQNLSLEENFIVRARAMFSQADAVYAVSIDRFSTFWLRDGQNQNPNAVEYTMSQPDRTRRLFVFDDPETAHEYRNVLAAHHSQYGRKEGGGVFMCSRDTYEKLLVEVVHGVPGRDRLLQDLQEIDFGFLVFGDLERDHELYEATLDQSELRCEKIDRIEGHRLQVMRRFDAWMTVKRGEHDGGVVRWGEEFKTSPTHWRDALAAMFETHASAAGVDSKAAAGALVPADEGALRHVLKDGDVYHLVFFSAEVDKPHLRRTVREEVQKLKALPCRGDASKALIKSVFYGASDDYVRDWSVTDHQYKGRLHTKTLLVRNYPYCLVMRFENVAMLQEYYEHLQHSKAREQIFRAFSDESSDLGPAMTRLYELAERDTKNQTAIYQAIEALASRYILRADLVEQTDLDTIVKGPSKQFELRPANGVAAAAQGPRPELTTLNAGAAGGRARRQAAG